MEAFQVGAGLEAEERVEVRERFVHEQHRRVHDERAGDGDALALTAGKLRGVTLEERRQAEELGALADARIDLRLRDTMHPQAESDVARHGHMWEHGVALEHHRDVAVARREIGDIALADSDVAAIETLQTRDTPQQRRLAASRRAEQDHELAVAYVDRDAFEGLRLPEQLGCVLDADT